MAIQTDTLTIRDEKVVVEVKHVDHKTLLFYVENPRIYSIVRENDEEPTQDDIEKQLKEMDHVHDLVKSIKRHGGLIEPLVVLKDTLEVIEGNSRLAAYRILAEKDPVKWQKAKCHILPAKIKASLISSLLSQYHLKGKKEWKPFEQAGFLYRRFYKEKVSLPDLLEESGLSKSKIEHFIETYKFMVDNKDTHLQRWSYYDVYLKPKKIKKMRDEYPTFDTVVVQMIKNGEFNEARDVRDKLPLICDGPKKNLEKFLNGKIDFAAAVSHVAENKDGINGQKHLNKFRTWIAQPKRLDALTASNGEIRKKVLFEVRSIHDCLTKLRAKLEKPS